MSEIVGYQGPSVTTSTSSVLKSKTFTSSIRASDMALVGLRLGRVVLMTLRRH
jgi:hypothetical protein